MIRYLSVYGHSDDCVEFEGAVRAEFYAYRPRKFYVTVRRPDHVRSLEITAKYDYDWEFEYKVTRGAFQVIELNGPLVFILGEHEVVDIHAEGDEE